MRREARLIVSVILCEEKGFDAFGGFECSVVTFKASNGNECVRNRIKCVVQLFNLVAFLSVSLPEIVDDTGENVQFLYLDLARTRRRVCVRKAERTYDVIADIVVRRTRLIA
jgi:hypothetical protein